MNNSYEPKPWPEVLCAEEAERYMGGQTMLKIAREMGLKTILEGNRISRYHFADLRAFIEKIKVEMAICRRRGLSSQNPILSAYR